MSKTYKIIGILRESSNLTNVKDDASIDSKKQIDKKLMSNKMFENKRMSDIPISNIQHATSNVAITLIALIITIIVLLILAGVTLNMVLGEDGIINKANLAKIKTEESQNEEINKLNDIENNINTYTRTGSTKYEVLWQGTATDIGSEETAYKLKEPFTNYDILYVDIQWRQDGMNMDSCASEFSLNTETLKDRVNANTNQHWLMNLHDIYYMEINFTKDYSKWWISSCSKDIYGAPYAITKITDQTKLR